MAKFFDVGGTPLVASNSGRTLAWENKLWMPVPSGLVTAGTELTVGAFERSFPKVDMPYLFDLLGARNPIALLAKAHVNSAQNAKDMEEVDYSMQILEAAWKTL